MTLLYRNWRWMLAIVFFLLACSGFVSGVQVTERDISNANLLTLMYYSLGLFILGGLDLGVPHDGPSWGRACLWVAYFGSPLLTTSAIAEWLQVVVANPTRWLHSLRQHVVVVGVNDLSRSIMDKLILMDKHARIVVVDRDIRKPVRQELEDKYGARCLAGDYTDEYFLSMLRMTHAKQVVLLSSNDFDNFETASKLIAMRPDLGQKTILHCNKLRYLREMAHSEVVQKMRTFNSYQLAAQHFVRSVMPCHFRQTGQLGTVVLAGYGRFGQTVLEELQLIAGAEMVEIAIIDIDAHRRVLVAEEHVKVRPSVKKHVFQSEIGHPDVWHRVEAAIDLDAGSPLVLMATGQDDENLRAGIRLSKRHPNARVMIRSQRESHFVASVGRSSSIVTFGLSQLFQESLPDSWFTDAQTTHHP